MTDEAKALVALQRAAGLKTMPTPLTHDLRIAVSGKGPRAYDWQDKPHRLLYDACTEIETQAREIERLREALKTADAWLDRWARHIGDCPGIDDCTCGLTRVRYEAITALAGDSHDQ